MMEKRLIDANELSKVVMEAAVVAKRLKASLSQNGIKEGKKHVRLDASIRAYESLLREIAAAPTEGTYE